MKRLTAVVLLILVVLTGCTGPKKPDLASLEADLTENSATLTEAVYTNRNGHSSHMDYLSMPLLDISLTESSEENDLFYMYGTANVADDSFFGETAFCATYRKDEDEYKFLKLECDETEVQPTVPLDFSHPDAYKLFQDDYGFKYKKADDKEGRATGKIEITADTLENIEVVKELDDEEQMNSSYQRYILRLHFSNGLTTEGTFSFEYWPAVGPSGLEDEGFCKWETLVIETPLELSE